MYHDVSVRQNSAFWFLTHSTVAWCEVATVILYDIAPFTSDGVSAAWSVAKCLLAAAAAAAAAALPDVVPQCTMGHEGVPLWFSLAAALAYQFNYLLVV